MGQSELSSARVHTCRLIIVISIMNTKLLVVFLVSGHCVLGARQLRGQAGRRDGKSLVGTFPFNANNGAGDDTDVSFGAVAAAGPGSDGKRCIDKVEMVEETEYDDVVQCDHSYDKRCHTTY